jgi:competence ComEA-like helix-hairpin-helix protein
VEHRSLSGPFRAPEDLLGVSGIGAATLSRIEALLDLSNPPAGLGLELVAGGGADGASRPSGLLDLNRAGPLELESLPGIGPALAQRIVEHRARIGRFGRVEDLLEVSGIGPATLERLRPLVRVGG